jgi:hypothetical protein
MNVYEMNVYIYAQFLVNLHAYAVWPFLGHLTTNLS